MKKLHAIDPSFQFNVKDAKEAIAIQHELRGRIRLLPFKKRIRMIGGVDVSMDRFAKFGFGGFVILDRNMKVLERSIVRSDIPFPYIPGLLSFREIPMLVLAWENLANHPDILLVDGVGIAHPRRMGIATHLGLLLDIPTIGCAKNVLIGRYDEPENKVGAYSYLYDPKTNEIIGAALRTKSNVRPMFISPGHLVTIDDALRIVVESLRGYRMPEPTRQAHNEVNLYRKAYNDSVTK